MIGSWRISTFYFLFPYTCAPCSWTQKHSLTHAHINTNTSNLIIFYLDIPKRLTKGKLVFNPLSFLLVLHIQDILSYYWELFRVWVHGYKFSTICKGRRDRTVAWSAQESPKERLQGSEFQFCDMVWGEELIRTLVSRSLLQSCLPLVIFFVCTVAIMVLSCLAVAMRCIQCRVWQLWEILLLMWSCGWWAPFVFWWLNGRFLAAEAFWAPRKWAETSSSGF